MPAQINEMLLDRFRVDAETLRDLDAILHQRGQEIDPNVDILYQIWRRDGLQYETRDIEEVLRERNGPETGLTTLVAKSIDSTALELALTLSDSLKLHLKSEDRGKAVFAASDLRSLARERMRASASPFPVSHTFIAMAVAMLTFFGVFFYDMWESDRRSAEYDAARAVWEQEYEAWQQNRSSRAQQKAESFRAQADAAIASGSTDDRLNLLIEQQARELEEAARVDRDRPESPDYESSNISSMLLTYGAAVAAFGLTRVSLALAWPERQSFFLIGDGLVRDRKRQQRRERWVWGVAISLGLGVISSILASRFFGA